MEGNTLFSEKPTLYKGSAEFVSSDLSYGIPATDVSVDKVPIKVPYFPLSSLREQCAPIEFLITPDAYGYIDMKNIELSVLGRIVRQDGKWLDNTDIVAPTNLAFQHLWRQLEVHINNTIVMDCPYYAVMAHMTRLLACNPLEKAGSLKDEFWYPDKTPEDYTIPEKGKPANGFALRQQWAMGSHQFSLLGKFIGNVFSTNRYFPPSTEIRIILRRNLPELCIDCASDTKAPFVGCPYRFNVDECILYVPRVTVREAVVKQHEEILNKGETLTFPMVNREIKTFTIPKGFSSFTADSVILGRIPRIIVVGLVSQAGWLGKLSKSPVNFQGKTLSEMQLNWSGDAMESRKINYSFLSKTNPLESILLALDTLKYTAANPELGNGIDRDTYHEGSKS